MKELPIRVSTHAVDRAIERFPEDFVGGRDEVVRTIRREVERAFAEQRVSKTKPRWLVTEDGPRRKAEYGDRFVWDGAQRHCYVVAASRRRGGAKSALVITVLRTYDEAWQMRARAKNG